MNLLKITARIASGPLSDRRDYGSNEDTEIVAQQEQTGVVKKTPGKKEWCVKSESNPEWSGGCYKSEGKAKERLNQVEFFKHKK